MATNIEFECTPGDSTPLNCNISSSEIFSKIMDKLGKGFPGLDDHESIADRVYTVQGNTNENIRNALSQAFCEDGDTLLSGGFNYNNRGQPQDAIVSRPIVSGDVSHWEALISGPENPDKYRITAFAVCFENR